ncbi:MAG: hypothetical protein OHK0029_43190 [Armatimonadaceae bacterium]
MRTLSRFVALLAAVAACAPSAVAQVVAPVFDIPQITDIAIDGKPEDWQERGFAVESLAPVNGPLVTPTDHDARFRLAWNEKGLLLVQVRDDIFTEGENVNELWQKDSLEIFAGVRRGERDWLQILVGPGVDTRTPDIRYHFDDHRETESLRAISPRVEVARTRTADGYTLEALIPWVNLGIKPAMEREIAFQLVVNDVDGESERSQLMWFPEEGAYSNPTRMHRVRLAEAPSPAQRVAILPDYERFPRTRLQLIAPADDAGKTVEAVQRDANRTYGRTILRPRSGRAVGSLTISHPLDGPLAAVELLSGEQSVGSTDLRDPQSLRQSVLNRAEIRFQPYVFSGESFPNFDFAEPERIEQLIGPYYLDAQFYDAGGNPVTRAQKTGRYGAIVTVTPQTGERFKRFQTLYRLAEPLDNPEAISAAIRLPSASGIGQKVLDEQKGIVSELFQNLLLSASATNPETPMYLAGLSELKPGDPPVDRNSPIERDRRYWVSLKSRTNNLKQYAYLSYTPKDYEANPNQKYPLLLFLHGAGERGSDLSLVRTHGPMKLVGQGKDFPFVIIAPQCPVGEWWSPTQLGLLLDEIEQKYRIDKERIYVTGLSMGGFGTWALALEYPNRFAAIAPICGGGDPADAARLRSLPTWVFHGAKDTLVPLNLSEEMVAAMQKTGGEAKLTIYPDAGHDSWTETYNNPDLYTWLLDQKRQP